MVSVEHELVIATPHYGLQPIAGHKFTVAMNFKTVWCWGGDGAGLAMQRAADEFTVASRHRESGTSAFAGGL